MNTINKDTIIFDELIKKQLKNINDELKLNYNDLKRLSLKIEKSIFDKEECCLLKNNDNNINFYLNKKKVSLHRLLYINFIGPLDKKTYIKTTCKNIKICYNINHFIIKNNIINNKNIDNDNKNIDNDNKNIDNDNKNIDNNNKNIDNNNKNIDNNNKNIENNNIKKKNILNI